MLLCTFGQEGTETLPGRPLEADDDAVVRQPCIQILERNVVTECRGKGATLVVYLHLNVDS